MGGVEHSEDNGSRDTPEHQKVTASLRLVFIFSGVNLKTFVTHHLRHTTLSHTIFHTPLCHTPSFTNHLSPTQLCHTPSLTHHLSHHFVTHHLSHTTLSHTTFHIQLVLLLDAPPPPLSFLPSPSRYNICCPLLEEVDMWGYPVL